MGAQTVLGPAADPAAPSVFTDRVLSLAFSPDGTLLAAEVEKRLDQVR